MATKGDLPIRAFATPDEWAAWLDDAHVSSPGLWLKIAKRGASSTTVAYAEALEIALCYGWIDGQKGALDDAFWLQRFTRRGPRSKWSKRNRDLAEALIASGRMKPAGLSEVERAKQDGRWDAAYAGQASAEVPADLRAAFDRDEGARAFFETLSRANRYAILYRIQDAKKPETRARRIAKYVAMCAEKKTIH